MSYKIFTDSSANLTNNLIDKYDLGVVSLSYFVDGVEYHSYLKDSDNDLKNFYKLMREKKSASTSCVNSENFYNIFKPVLENGEDLLYIGFSSGLSLTYSEGKKAIDRLQQEFPERKAIAVDSLCASLGEGLFVYYACELKSQGKAIEEVAQWLEENKLKLCHLFTVDDLYYLFKGGRVGKTAYIVGSIVKLKPVLHVDNNGKLVPIGRVIGRKKALTNMVERVCEKIVNPENQNIFISHGDCIDDVNFVVEKLREKIKFKDVVVNYVDPVIGCHSGPGTLAIFFLANDR